MSPQQDVLLKHPAIKSIYSHDPPPNLVREGTSITVDQLSCLWWGTNWQAASSRIGSHFIAFPILSTSATPHNHYPPPPSLFCSMWVPHWTSSQKSVLDSQLREKQSSSPVPGALGLIQTPDSGFRGTGEKYWLEMMMHMQEKLHNSECAWMNAGEGKKSSPQWQCPTCACTQEVNERLYIYIHTHKHTTNSELKYSKQLVTPRWIWPPC